MKVQIRKNVFESNSSSTHSICISWKNIDRSKLPDHVEFTHDEFGWTFGVLKDMYSKASYLYEALYACYGKDSIEEKKNQIAEMLGYYGITCEFEGTTYDEWGYTNGYIDHGYGTINFVETVLEDSDKLLRYLFGDSIIVLGNDNDSAHHEYMCGTDDWNAPYLPMFNDYEIFEKGN